MAAVSITAANVGIASLNVSLEPVTAGEAVTQGQSVYLKASDQKWYKADANASSATAAASGLVITPAATDGQAIIARSGLVKIGGTVAVGTPYCVGPVAGEIVPYSDLTTGDYVTFIGTAATTSTINLSFDATGYQKP
jgi:hypothetical protein